MADLTDLQRKRLDAIVQQMTANNEPEGTIQAVVDDFKAKYAGPEQPKSLASQIASGAWEGVKNIGAGIAGLATAPARMPFQLSADVARFAQAPRETLSQKASEMGQFVKGMIPFNQTLSDVFSGKTPSPEQVSREATELGAGYAVGKYAVPSAIGSGKRLVKALPGSSVELNEMAAGKLRTIPEGIRPPTGAVTGAYQTLKAMNAPPVAMNETLATAQNLLTKEASLAAPDRGFMKTLRGVISKAQGGMSFEDIQNNVVDFGEKIGQVQASRGTKLGELKDLFAALHADAANAIPAGRAAGGPDPALIAKSAAWDAARGVARRNFAANDLTSMIEKSGISTVGDGFTQVNTNKIVSQIEDMTKLAGQDKRAKLFVESFRPGELEDITKTLKTIGKGAPKVPVKTGAPVGSSQRWIEAGIGGLTGTVVGGVAGHPGLGATVGSLSGPLVSNLLARAMMTPTGRALVRRAVEPTGSITPQGAAIIAAFLKGEGQTTDVEGLMPGAKDQPVSRVTLPVRTLGDVMQ